MNHALADGIAAVYFFPESDIVFNDRITRESVSCAGGYWKKNLEPEGKEKKRDPKAPEAKKRGGRYAWIGTAYPAENTAFD